MNVVTETKYQCGNCNRTFKEEGAALAHEVKCLISARTWTRERANRSPELKRIWGGAGTDVCLALALTAWEVVQELDPTDRLALLATAGLDRELRTDDAAAAP